MLTFLFWFVFIAFYMGAFGFMGYKFYHGYIVAEGTVWQRLHATFTSSTTLAWGYAQIVGSYVIENIERLANAVNLPEVSNFIMHNVNPGFAATFVFVSGLITCVARVRGLFASN